jgi:hypothetical protein
MTDTTGYRVDKFGTYIEKDPQSRLDYSIDWSDWMPSEDSILNSSWTIQTITGDLNPLTTDDDQYNASTSITTIYLAGGTAGNTYRITNTITTDDGLIDERYFRLVVRDRTIR